MALEPKFFIEEHRDARSLKFTDLTGVYDSEENPGGFGSPNPDTGDITELELSIIAPNQSEYTFVSSYIPEIQIFTEDLVYPGTTYADGVYKVKLKYSTASEEFESEWEFFGFASIIAGEVMRTSLDYHPSESREKKEWILEQHRLLNNLRFSAQTGNLEYFDENLEQLQKIR